MTKWLKLTAWDSGGKHVFIDAAHIVEVADVPAAVYSMPGGDAVPQEVGERTRVATKSGHFIVVCEPAEEIVRQIM